MTQDSPPQTLSVPVALSVQVAPPHLSTDESGSTAGVHQPTPLEKLRAAARSYFPDMFNGPKDEDGGAGACSTYLVLPIVL